MIRSSLVRFVALTIFGVSAATTSAQWTTVQPDAAVPDWRPEVPIAVHPDRQAASIGSIPFIITPNLPNRHE